MQTAAHEGISTVEQLENIAQLYGQPVGKVANQLGLSFANGVIESLPAKIMGLGPRGVNYVSQSFGGDKVVGDFSDIGNNISRVNKESRDHDPYFTNSDGTKTAVGEVMEWGNRGAENLFDAGFVTLASGLWGAEAVAAGAIPLNTAYSYFRDYQETLNQLNGMQGHVLGTNPEIMTHFRWNKQLGKSDDDALNEAKNAVAKKRASLSAGGRLAREVIDLKLSGAVPEQKESLLLEFGKNLSFNVLADKLGQYIQRAMENGQIVHTGDTAM